MGLERIVRTMTMIVDPVAKFFNRIATYALAAMMAVTGIDVALRYIFNRPITGSYEIIEFLMPIAVGCGLAYCALEEKHVRVELLTSALPLRAQAAANSFSHLVFFILFALITWQTFLRATGMIASGQSSEVLYLPIYPFVLVLTACCAILCLVTLSKFFYYLHEAIKG